MARTLFQTRVNRLTDAAVATFGEGRRFSTSMIQQRVRTAFMADAGAAFEARDTAPVYSGALEQKWERDVAARLRALLAAGTVVRRGRGVYLRAMAVVVPPAAPAPVAAPTPAPAPVAPQAPAPALTGAAARLADALALVMSADPADLLVAAEARGKALADLLTAEDVVRGAIAVAEAEGMSAAAPAAGSPF
jgi:hypothetical protein